MEIRPIRSEADYQWALGEASKLWRADPGTSDGDYDEILSTLIEAYEVSSAVNRTANDMPMLVEPLTEPEPDEPPKPKTTKKEKAKIDDGQASLF